MKRKRDDDEKLELNKRTKLFKEINGKQYTFDDNKVVVYFQDSFQLVSIGTMREFQTIQRSLFDTCSSVELVIGVTDGSKIPIEQRVEPIRHLKYVTSVVKAPRIIDEIFLKKMKINYVCCYEDQEQQECFEEVKKLSMLLTIKRVEQIVEEKEKTEKQINHDLLIIEEELKDLIEKMNIKLEDKKKNILEIQGKIKECDENIREMTQND